MVANKHRQMDDICHNVLLKSLSSFSYSLSDIIPEYRGTLVFIQLMANAWIAFRAWSVIPICPATLAPSVANKTGLNSWKMK